jgi:hypothetical protein
VLALYVGAILGQARCLHHASDMESHIDAGLDGFAAQASSSMAPHGSPPTGGHSSSSRTTHGSSQHGEHPGAPGPDHSGACAMVACASAITATPDYGLGPMNKVSNAAVAYLGVVIPPDTEMVPPPPRLG